MELLLLLNLCNIFCLSIFLSLFRDSDVEEGEMEREMSVLCGVIEHLLPRVGSHVRTLDLAHGKAVTNEVVRPLISFMYKALGHVPKLNTGTECIIVNASSKTETLGTFSDLKKSSKRAIILFLVYYFLRHTICPYFSSLVLDLHLKFGQKTIKTCSYSIASKTQTSGVCLKLR